MKKRLNDWVYEWLETYKKVMVKPSTYDSVDHTDFIKATKQLEQSFA